MIIQNYLLIRNMLLSQFSVPIWLENGIQALSFLVHSLLEKSSSGRYWCSPFQFPCFQWRIFAVDDKLFRKYVQPIVTFSLFLVHYEYSVSFLSNVFIFCYFKECLSNIFFLFYTPCTVMLHVLDTKSSSDLTFLESVPPHLGLMYLIHYLHYRWYIWKAIVIAWGYIIKWNDQNKSNALFFIGSDKNYYPILKSSLLTLTLFIFAHCFPFFFTLWNIPSVIAKL